MVRSIDLIDAMISAADPAAATKDTAEMERSRLSNADPVRHVTANSMKSA